MVKINSKTISEPVSNIIKKIETPVTEHTENTRAIADNLTARANSAIAGISLPKLSVKSVLEKHTKFLKSLIEETKIKKTKNDYSKVEEYINSLSNDSAKLQDIDDLITLVQKGKLDKKVLNFLNKDSQIPQVISDDLAVLRTKNKKIIDAFIPEFKNKEEAITSTNIGDVFQIKGNKTVSIINKNGEIENLSMDKKNYYELFPPVKRFANVQPDNFGNCYEITALNALIENPKTRENVLRCIDTISNKDQIIVKFPRSNFKNGINVSINDIEREGNQYYSNGCDGIKLIEHALGKEYEKPFNEFLMKHYEKKGNTETVDKLKKHYQRNKYDNSEIKNLLEFEGSLGRNLREGGDAVVVWRIMGLGRNQSIETDKFLDKIQKSKHLIDNRNYLDIYKTDKIITDKEQFAEQIWNPTFFENNLVEAYIGDQHSNSDLSKLHSYRLKPIYDKNGKIDSYLLKNPHGLADQKISFDDIFDKIDSISFSKI